MNRVKICKIFTFDAAHQLSGHKGKCANVHGHTYTLEVVVSGEPQGPEVPGEEGFVMDFGDLKEVVRSRIVDPLDHAFLAVGNEPFLDSLRAAGSKIAQLGFRTTAENLAMFIAFSLLQASIPVYSVKVWETPTSWAEVLSSEIPQDGPSYRKMGVCDVG